MNPIVIGIGKKALDLFYKKFGRRIIKTAADSKWLANKIRLLKLKAHKPKTSDVAQRVREKILKDKPFEVFTPKIVNTKNKDNYVKSIVDISNRLRIKIDYNSISNNCYRVVLKKDK